LTFLKSFLTRIKTVYTEKTPEEMMTSGIDTEGWFLLEAYQWNF